MVPRRMKDAALGMGCTRTQVIWHIVLPTGLPGILTGVILAVARVAGESAPLLFTALFSNYWLSSLQRADRVAVDPDLQLLQHAVREPDRAGLGGLAGAGPDRAGLQHPQPPGRPSQDLRQGVSRCLQPSLVRNESRRRRWSTPPSPTAQAPARGDRLQDRQALLRRLSRRARQLGADRDGQDHRLHRPVRLRQEHRAAQPEPDERPDRRLPPRGPRAFPRPGHLRQGGRSGRGAPPHRHGVPAAEPVRDEHLRQRRLRPAAQPLQGQPRREGREGAARRGAVGRGEGQAQEERPVAVGRPAAAALHRPRHRHRARPCC